MKLEQGQIWKQGELYYRIVEWARMYIEYKVMRDPATKEGTFHQLSKKEFCRLLKGAVLIPNVKASAKTGDEEIDEEANLLHSDEEAAFTMHPEIEDQDSIP